MLMSINNNKYIIANSKLNIEGDIYCPYCNSKTIFKNGTINIPHFAHKEKTNCIYSEYVKEKCGTGKGGESKEHLKYKLDFKRRLEKFKEVKEVRLEEKIGDRIADIVVYFSKEDYLKRDKAIIEIQLSKIQLKTIEKRTEEYLKHGFKKENIYWLFGEKNKKYIKDYNFCSVKSSIKFNRKDKLEDIKNSSYDKIEGIIREQDLRNDSLIVFNLYVNANLVSQLIKEEDYYCIKENMNQIRRIFKADPLCNSTIIKGIKNNFVCKSNYNKIYNHINIILDIAKKYPILDNEDKCRAIYNEEQRKVEEWENKRKEWENKRKELGKELKEKYFNMSEAERKQENLNVYKLVAYILNSIYRIPKEDHKQIKSFYKYSSYRNTIVDLKNNYGFTVANIANIYLYIEKVKKIKINNEILLKHEIIDNYQEAETYYKNKVA